jgi:hypothetical protein
VRDIAIGKDNFVDAVLGNELLQVFLFENRDASRVQFASKLGRIAAIRDIGDLGCRKSNHRKGWVVAKYNVKVMEITARSTHDDNFPHGDLPAEVTS